MNGVVSGAAPFVSYTALPANSGRCVGGAQRIFHLRVCRADGTVRPERFPARYPNLFGVPESPAAGTYTLIVGASAPRTAGAFALVWQLLNSPAGTAPLRVRRHDQRIADAGERVPLLLPPA